MKYLYIDGDNIGLKIEQSFLNNDEKELSTTNQKVITAVSRISMHLKDKDQHIIFAGADGIICRGHELNLSELLKVVRSAITGMTFSIGIGSNLKNCYIALRYAKSLGKNIAVEYSDELNFLVIEE